MEVSHREPAVALALREDVRHPFGIAHDLERRARPFHRSGSVELRQRLAQVDPRREARNDGEQHERDESAPDPAHDLHARFFFTSGAGLLGSPPSSACTKVPPWYFSVNASAPGGSFFRISAAQPSLSSCGL